MKKKLVSITIVTALVLGSMQVYAATVLDSNIIELIRNGFAAIKASYATETKKNMDEYNEQYKGIINQYVDSKSDDAISQIEDHKNKETARAEQELNTYLNSIRQEIDVLTNQQVKDSKDMITDEVNSGINKIKEEINKELEKQIKGKLFK